MSTHNIHVCFYGEIWKIIPKLSLKSKYPRYLMHCATSLLRLQKLASILEFQVWQL